MTGIYYDTNDDRFRAEILSGILTGTPDARMVCSNSLLMWILATLYQYTRAIPWYGIGLIGLLGLALVFVVKNFLLLCRNRMQALTVLGISIAFLLLQFYAIGLIQFTSVAIYLSIAAYVSLILNPDKKRKWVEYILLSSLGYLLRNDGMLMVQIPGWVTYAGLVLVKKSYSKESKSKECMKPVLIVLGIMIVGWLGNWIGYHGEEWQAYLRYNDARVELFDYTGKPNYEQVRDILDKYNVSEATYVGFQNYVILDWDISVECAQELLAYMQEIHTAPTWNKVGQELWKQLWTEHHWNVNRTAICLLLMVIVIVIGNGHYALLLPIGMLEAGKMVVWVYLIYRGRLVHRVTLPLFACEMALLLAVMVRSFAEEHTAYRRWKEILFFLFSAMLCVQSYQSGKMQYRYVQQRNHDQDIYIQGMWEIEDYCRLHPENRYLQDSFSMSYYVGSALDTKLYEPRNSLITGGWFSQTPTMQKALKEYLSADVTSVYLIIYEDGYSLNKPAVIYLSEKTASEPMVVDRFTVTHGGQYAVYYFAGNPLTEE